MPTGPWDFIMLALINSPWLAIAIAAGIIFGKRGKSAVAAIQALGALAMFLLPLASWVISWTLAKAGAPVNYLTAAQHIFQFLRFVALVLFAAGFCWEKFAQWCAKPAPAVPALPLK